MMVKFFPCSMFSVKPFKILWLRIHENTEACGGSAPKLPIAARRHRRHTSLLGGLLVDSKNAGEKSWGG